jgi:hypothetical protein
MMQADGSASQVAAIRGEKAKMTMIFPGRNFPGKLFLTP